MWDGSRIPRTNSLLFKYTRDRNSCHPPAIARERAAGGHRTTSVGYAHPTLLAKRCAESVAACPVTLLLRTRDIFASRTNSNSSAFLVVPPLISIIYMCDEFRIPPCKPLVADLSLQIETQHAACYRLLYEYSSGRLQDAACSADPANRRCEISQSGRESARL